MEEKRKFIKKEDFTKESLLEFDELTVDVLKQFVESRFATVSMTMRKFSIGYVRALNIVEKLEQIGFISPANGLKTREVYLTKDEFTKMFEEEKTL